MKTDPKLAEYYEDRLVPTGLQHLGDKLRTLLGSAIDTVLELKGGSELMSAHPVNKQGIALRNPYIDPLNVLQAELLYRLRHLEEDKECKNLEQALMITVAGIAAGMRNTG